jgi:organic hydroperoxide reductase OsmC/OhrA
VAEPQAKTFRYAVAVDRTGRISADGGAPYGVPDDWKPEHLLLAGLCRCTLESLRHHARRAALDFVGSATASGRVTRRDDDGRYAFVDVDCSVDLEVDPAPPGDELTALLAKAERDCFVGASLTAPPRYSWRVNGVETR